jgi:hypothetical protein
MRSTGFRNLIVYCGDYKCAHSVTMNADRWSDHVRLSDLEPLFVCQVCGHRARMSGRCLTGERMPEARSPLLNRPYKIKQAL